MLVDPCDPRRSWLLVRTRPKQERLAAEHLAARGIEAYLPRVLEPRTHRRGPCQPQPLFPSYVFARTSLCERRAAVAYCPGVAGLVRFGGLFAAVEDAVVDLLRRREGDRGFVDLRQVRRELPPGARVRIRGGPLAGFAGLVSRHRPGSARVELLLDLVRGSRRVEVGVEQVVCA